VENFVANKQVGESYRVGLYIRQSPPNVFNWTMHVRMYASFSTLCSWTYDAYMRQSTAKVLISLANSSSGCG